MEAAAVWNACRDLHRTARQEHTPWPGQHEMQQATKTRPQMRMKYPWRTKRFYPVTWTAQAVSKERGRVVLPMGKGHKALVLPLELPENSGACTLVWNHGFELHVCIEAPKAEQSPGEHRAAVDLGQLAKKQSRCKKYSRRWKKLQRARNKVCKRAIRRVRDARHKATRQVIDFCVANQVGTLFIGNPHGVRNRDTGRHHNQRMAGWEYGKDIDYLSHKAKAAHISCFTGSERGTSSQCPGSGHRHKPKNRNWVCRACGFRGHRDLVGSVNMHKPAYRAQVMFPRSFTYLRASPVQE